MLRVLLAALAVVLLVGFCAAVYALAYSIAEPDALQRHPRLTRLYAVAYVVSVVAVVAGLLLWWLV